MSRRLRTPIARTLAAAALVFLAAACAETATAPSAAILTGARSGGWLEGDIFTDPSMWYRRVYVCKYGSDALFEVSVDGGAPAEHTVLDGQCNEVHFNSGGVDEVDVVTVTEVVAIGMQLDSIVQDSTHNADIVRLPTITGTNTTTVTTTRSKGGIVRFYNSFEAPPSGGQGCTPGYWKQSQHFDSWTAPYTPNTLFSAVFDDAFPGMTLLQVLGQGGGGLKALGRHTVAALLNAASADVNDNVGTPAGVISAFNDVFPDGDYQALHILFAGYNEQGCPLN